MRLAFSLVRSKLQRRCPTAATLETLTLTVPVYAPRFTISRPGESTIILPHARNAIDRVGEIHLLRVTGESISYIANCIHGNQKKKNKLQPIVWLTLCIQLIIILSLGICVRLTVCVHISA